MHIAVHILSAHGSAGERGSVSLGRPRGRRRSSDEDGARDVDYRKHKLSKNAMLRTIMPMMTMATMTVDDAEDEDCGESLGGAAAPSRQPAICPPHHSQ